MLESSPGYALFTDLRREMGTTSSQPVPSPKRDAIASPVASPATERRSHFIADPMMDDAAASQQLMDEKSTRVSLFQRDMSLSQLDGMHSSPLQKKRKRSSTQKMASQVPASSPFPFPATQPEPELLAVKDSTHSTAVEVPDSQIPGPPAHATASSPMSSHVIPSSATKSKRTYKQSKQARRDRAISDAMQGAGTDQDGDTAMIVDEAASGLHNRVEVASASKTVPLRKGATEAPDGTPTPAKRQKIGTPGRSTLIRDLIQDGEDEDAKQPRHVEKSKLKRIKKPQTPIARPKNVYEIPDDDPRPTNGYCDNGEAKDTSTRKPRSSLNKAKKTKGEVRTPRQPLGEVEDEESIMREPISSDEAKDPGSPSDDDGHSDFKVEKKKRQKRSSTKKATPRQESGKYTYRQKPLVGTAAERALEAAHDLQHPPDLQSTGEFTQDEEEIIRRAVKDYQQRKGLDVSELVEIIQWNPHDPGFNCGDGTVSGKDDWSPQDIEDARESAEFWDDIKHINTHRSLDRLRRHIRQTYHQFKSGAWTDEEGQRLKNLYGMHPNKWKVISVGMGDRSMYDCQNRWRDYLQYGDKLKSSRWDEEEEELLIRAIHTVAQRDEDHRAESGLPPIVEYTIKDINWQQVSREMDNTRSRIQVVQKWRNLQKRESPPQIQVEHKPRKEKPTTSVALPEPTPRKRGRPARKEGEVSKTYSDKSHEVIENSDDDGVQTLPPPKKRRRPRKSGGTDMKAKKFRTTETDKIVDNSDEEGHASKVSDSPPKKKKRRKSRKSEGAEVEEAEKIHPTETQDVIENSDEEQVYANQQLETSPPPPKKRGRPRKSEGTEAEDQESHSIKMRDAIVNSDKEDAHAEQQAETSPPRKNLGRPRKSDAVESNESKERIEPEVSEDSVEDVEVEDDHQSEHVEDDDKRVPDTQLDSVQEVADDQPQEDGDDAEPKVNGESFDAHDQANAAPVKSPDQAPRENGDQVSVAPVVSPAPSPKVDDAGAQKENEDPIEDDEDQPSVARSNSSMDMDDDQSEKSSEDALSKENHELAGEKETEPSVTSTSSDGKKPTVAATYKMQWGDKFDLIAKLQERRDEEEGDIDWEGIAEEVATDRPYIWSPQALQSTLEQLIQLLRDNYKEVDGEDLPGTVDDIMDFISTEHGDQVEEYYDLL